MTITKKLKYSDHRQMIGNDNSAPSIDGNNKVPALIQSEHNVINASHSSTMPPACPVSVDGEEDLQNKFFEDLDIRRDPFVAVNMILLVFISIFWWVNDGSISMHVPRNSKPFLPFDFFSPKTEKYVPSQSEAISLSFGSAIRISHLSSGGYELETGAINFGSGSGQQAVTLTPPGEGSLWLIKSFHGQNHISSGSTPVKCGSKIRLEHMGSKKNLHSNNYNSPISGNQEVSAFGDKNGEGDGNDNWKVICNGKYWVKGGTIQLKNTATGQFLSANTQNVFNSRIGCGEGCPVSGHLEACAISIPYKGTQFQATVGIFLSS